MNENYIVKDSIYEEMLIKDALNNRKIHVNEDVTDTSMFKVRYYMDKIKKIDDLEDIPYGEREPIEIVLGTYGGSIYEMLGTLGYIKHFQKEYKYTIITTCTTKSMSCGAVILALGNIRRCYKYSTILIHKLSGGAWGDFDKLENQHEEYVRLQSLMEEIISEHTKIPLELLKQKTHGIDWYISPKEALELGIIDEII